MVRMCEQCSKVEVPKRHRFCDSCKKTRKLKTFGDWAKHNKTHRKKWQKEYQQTNTYKSNLMLRTYGITQEEYNEMLKEQDYSCAICQTHQDEFENRLSIDHNHNTGSIRGLLCSNCNTAIGLLGDNLESIQKALDYLKVLGE